MDERIKELEALVKSQTEELAKLAKEASDLRLEKESFAEENESLKKAFEDLKKDNEDTKKLNFTLARSLSKDEKSVESIMNDLF